MLKQNRIPELMDDPALDAKLHQAALRDLSRLNKISRSAELTAAPILKLARARAADKSASKLKILDVASGAGDLAIALQKICATNGVEISIHGLDFSPFAVAAASAEAEAHGLEKSCTFSCQDVLETPLPDGYDVIVTSLFTHHLDAPEVKKLLAEMALRTNCLVLVNDLVRSNTSLFFVKLTTLLFTSSPIVRYDGPVSVVAAYTTSEMRDLALSAGLSGARVDMQWPCRYLLSWSKNDCFRNEPAL